MSISRTIVVSLLALSVVAFSCSEDSLEEPATPMQPDNSNEEPTDSTRIVWSGAATSFSKANGADPGQAENQDRISSSVWITRGNDGGQIYNARSESNANKSTSPAGTRWAEGTLSQIDDLEFKNFRAAVGNPKNVVGKNLVLHLVEDNIYLSVRFTRWSQGKNGGFAYERSTEN